MLTEGANIFDAAAATATQEEPETSESSNETEKPAGQAGEEEAPKDLKPGEPLHKDERFRRLIADKNRLKQERDEMLDRISRLEQTQRAPERPQANEPIPAWFANYFGTEAQAKEAWEHLKPADLNALKAEIRDDLRREQEAQTQSTQKWDRWVNDQVESLEEEGETFERNALLKVMDQYRPSDNEGNLDFRKGLELLRLKGEKPNQVEAKRKAAAMTGTAAKGSEPSKKNVVSRADILKWRQTGEL